MHIEGVSPFTRLFLSEIKVVKFGPEFYTRRANIKRAYMEYLKVAGVSIKLSPSQFYEEVVAYLNHLDNVKNGGTTIIELGTRKGVDVIKGAMIPEFYADKCHYRTGQLKYMETTIRLTAVSEV